MSIKEELLSYNKEDDKLYGRRNSMKCLEAWYNPLFAINETFSKGEIESMPDKEIDDLMRLADTISEGLY